MGTAEYERCVDAAFRDFRKYDQIVDIVSAWEQFLADLSVAGEYYFDRFPEQVASQADFVTEPTFLSLVSEQYGIIFDVQQDVTQEASDYRDRIEPLLSIDPATLVESGPTPETYDVCLLVHTDNAQRVRVHLDAVGDEFDANKNLVPLEYSYIDQDTTPKYRFERMTLVGDNFRDETLPDQSQMSSYLSADHGGLKNIEIEVSDFDRNKATGVLCNQKPPNLYLACHLWDRVFYDQLNDGQRIVWQREDPSKTMSFEVAVDTLTEQLNRDYIPNGAVESAWVNDTLEYLCVVENAKRISEERYRIDFRNLREKRREYGDVSVRGGEFSDLAKLFAEWYCENTVEMDAREVEKLKEPDGGYAVEQSDDWTQPELGEF